MSLHDSLMSVKVKTKIATSSLITLYIIAILLHRYEVSLTGEPNLNVNKKDGKVSFTATQLNEETFYRFLVTHHTKNSDVCPGPVVSLPVMSKPCPGKCDLLYTYTYNMHILHIDSSSCRQHFGGIDTYFMAIFYEIYFNILCLALK